MAKDIILATENVKKYFPVRGGKVVKAVDGVSVEVERGKTLGIVGESGCGKSTLGRTIIRIYDPTEGRILLDGRDISGKSTKRFRQELARSIQMIFQDPYACLNPRMTVTDLIAEGWDLNSAIHLSKQERREMAVELLHKVGLNEEHANRFAHEFSGGQRQRIGIARTLALQPKLLIADEAVSALDVSVQAQIINLLEELQKSLHLTMLFISHDLSVVRCMTDRAVVMYLGKIMELTSSDELYDHPLHPYTQALISAAPIPNPKVDRARERILLKGEIPSPLNPPEGCNFCTRCPYATDLCREVEPEFVDVGNDHWVACHRVSGK